jgi:hypothetical protein
MSEIIRYSNLTPIYTSQPIIRRVTSFLIDRIKALWHNLVAFLTSFFPGRTPPITTPFTPLPSKTMPLLPPEEARLRAPSWPIARAVIHLDQGNFTRNECVILDPFVNGSGLYIGSSIGMTIETLAQKDYDYLDRTHDFIQLVYPSDIPSAYFSEAPLVTPRSIASIKAHPEAQERMRLFTLEAMCPFLGIRSTHKPDGSVALTFVDRKRADGTSVWENTSFGHNNQRITRMIRSLHLHGLEPLARELQRCVTEELRNRLEDLRVATSNPWEHWAVATDPNYRGRLLPIAST